MLTDNGNTGFYMPVAPAYNGYGNGGGFGGWGDDAWLILILLFAMGGWGGFGMGGFGGGFGGMYEFPWLLNGQQNILNGVNANTNAGFNQAATASAIGDLHNAVTAGFGDVQTALCGGFAGVNATVNNAQNAVSQQLYTNQIADLERSYAAQTANTQGQMAIQSQIANCCCENRAATQDVKYTIATEACATRQNSTANTQAILDKLCQLELDGVKAQVEAKNDRINELTTQLNMAALNASQNAQTAAILQGQNSEVDALYNRLKSCPVPAQPVYGNTPIFTCAQNVANSNYGCGCGGF